MIKHIKNIFNKDNLVFLFGSIIASIILLNFYGKILVGQVAPWMNLLMVITITMLGIYVVGWLLRLRKASMHVLELYSTIIIIVIIMLVLNMYVPQILFGATPFIEGSREAIFDMGRGFLG